MSRFETMATVAFSLLSIACISSTKAAELSGSAALTSDYVWRGSTQTQGDPAVQAGFKVAGNSAHYFLDNIYDQSYSHAQLSGVWAFQAPFELRVTAHATDSNAEGIFGDELAGNRVEAALQASF